MCFFRYLPAAGFLADSAHGRQQTKESAEHANLPPGGGGQDEGAAGGLNPPPGRRGEGQVPPGRRSISQLVHQRLTEGCVLRFGHW